MGQDDLFALLVLLIERNGGSLEVTQEEVMGLDMEGKVLAIVPDQMKDAITITVEREEDVEDGHIEG